MAPCRQQASAMFCGDAEHMVAALIEACEVKAVHATASAEWVGRALVPWVDDSSTAQNSSLEFEALETCGRRNHYGSKFPASAHKHVRSSRNPESPQQKKGQNKRSKAGSPTRATSPGSSACACPALAASPKPGNIPMPSSGLMNRALSRSPSPPKDAAVASWFAFNQAQQFVRPVVA